LSCAGLRATVPLNDITDRSGTVAKRALITGITGQDGSYLAEYLL
jgi:hypothetical protein